MIINNLPKASLANTSLYAGTSTGGIISLGLAAGIPVQTIVDLYSSHCSAIFNSADSPAATFDEIWNYIKTAFGSEVIADVLAPLAYAGIEVPINAFSAKYANSSLKSQLTTTFNSSPLGYSASTNISDVAARVFVTTFQLNDSKGVWQPISIDNLSPSSNDASLLDAALCTSAAPTYFPPHRTSSLGYCIDGGMFANDPSTFVLARLLSMGLRASKIRILSIGTGETANAIPPSYFSTVPPQLWGAYQYMLPISAPPSVPSETVINLMMDGSSDVDDAQTGEILGASYLRVNIPLNQPITLDDCNEVGTLQDLANKFTSDAKTFKPIVDWVKANFV